MGCQPCLAVMLPQFPLEQAANFKHASWYLWCATYQILIRALYALEARPVLIQLRFERLHALKCLLLLRLYGFLFCKLGIVVDCAGEGGEGCVELALQRRGG
jgi:hypothetical protein